MPTNTSTTPDSGDQKTKSMVLFLRRTPSQAAIASNKGPHEKLDQVQNPNGLEGAVVARQYYNIQHESVSNLLAELRFALRPVGCGVSFLG
jgi:hypothetical protein